MSNAIVVKDLVKTFGAIGRCLVARATRFRP